MSEYIKWTDSNVLFLKENYLNMSNIEISSHLGIDCQKIQSKLYLLRLNRPRTNHPEKDVCDDYLSGRFTLNLLSKKYNLSLKVIQGILNRNNINRIVNSGRKRRYEFNQHYFDVIDSENKAYWLGLLCADGCLNSSRITLRLIETDKYILEQFLQDIGGSQPINLVNIKDRYPHRNNQYNLSICSHYMTNILKSYGCIANKSLIFVPKNEQIPNHLIRHWIRGVWDGDGHVSLKSGKYLYCTVTGTYDAMNYISNYFYQIFDYHGILLNSKQGKNTYTLTYNGKKAAPIYKHLYSECVRKFDRKAKYLCDVENSMNP